MWKNWAGNRRSNAPLLKPETLDELAEALVQGKSMRLLGAGHSFTPLVEGASSLIDPKLLPAGTIEPTKNAAVWVGANRRLQDLSIALQEQGHAFRNLGDINQQTLAGAVSTATHGTGATLPSLSAEIEALRIMTASGEVVDTDSDPTGELLSASQVSLGLLGVILEARLKVVPRYRLRRRVTLNTLEKTLATMHGSWASHRHFEFFYLPMSGKCMNLHHDISDAPIGKVPRDLDDLAVRTLKVARNLGKVHPRLRTMVLHLLASFHSDEDYVGESWEVLCSQRGVRFVEMEYHVPVAEAHEVLKEVILRTESRHPNIYFPIEVRQTAGDTAFLSPFQGGNRVSIAIHADAREGDRGYFEDLEPIFRTVGGRPHWGKLFSMDRKVIEGLYPDFGRFVQVRQKLDPLGKFMSAPMKELFDGHSGGD